MLCSRSASLTSVTRRSREVAMNSLRKFSACLVSVEASCRLVSLVTPSTRPAISAPKRRSISAKVARVSSIVSCSSAVTMVPSSICCSARIRATATGMGEVRLAGAAKLALVHRLAEGVGVADQPLARSGVVGPNQRDEVVRGRHPLAHSDRAAAVPAHNGKSALAAHNGKSALAADNGKWALPSRSGPIVVASGLPRNRGATRALTAGAAPP